MHRRFTTWRPLKTILVSLAIALSSTLAHAATVSQVKGKKVIIDLKNSSTPVMEGERYFVVVNGKRRAVIKVTRVKGGRALATVVKGKPAVGASLAAAGKPSFKDTSSSSGSWLNGISVGGVVGFASDSQSVKADNGLGAVETVSMTGNGFSFKAFADAPLAGGLGVMARAGMEMFNVSGKTTTGKALTTEIPFGTGDLMLRYRFLETGFAPFAAIGLGIHVPFSPTTNALKVDEIGPTTVFFFAGGANYDVSPKLYIHAIVEYGLFPPSNDVSTNMIAGRAGLGYRF